MTKTGKRVLAHLAFWLLYMAWQLLQFSWDSRDYIRLEYSPELWVDYVMSIILVYMNLCILVPKFFYPKKYFLYGLTLLICLLCGGIYSRFMAWYYILPWERIHVPGMAHHGPTYFFIPIRIIRNALRYTPIVSLTFFLKLIQDAMQRSAGCAPWKKKNTRRSWTC